MGNVIYNRHTYLQPHRPQTLTLTTQWSYDSYGRVRNITYPDHEQVQYLYDRGGNLCRMIGTKEGMGTTPYIGMLQYDLFGQRTLKRLGNGMESRYAYDPRSRRLASLADLTPSGGLLQNVLYGYDAVGNILHIEVLGQHPIHQDFVYDSANRLVASEGNLQYGTNGIGYNSSYSYSPAGRMLTKEVQSTRLSNARGLHTVGYNNTYNYSSNNPFAVRSIQNGNSTTAMLDWDTNGNMVLAASGMFGERRLAWTEDNRLQGYREQGGENGSIVSYYNYTANGERNLKLTSHRLSMSVNGVPVVSNAIIDPTLYVSSLVTLSKHGYTKHYFEGTSRVCSKIGGGFYATRLEEVDMQVAPIESNYNALFQLQCDGLHLTLHNSLGINANINSAVNLHDVLLAEHAKHEVEPAFYYHTDHLGSTSYLTNDAAQLSQAPRYLPYGEDWLDINYNLDASLGQYTFNGKEKDYESGFHYYGTRYYWSEVLTGWLSVDPMADY